MSPQVVPNTWQLLNSSVESFTSSAHTSLLSASKILMSWHVNQNRYQSIQLATPYCSWSCSITCCHLLLCLFHLIDQPVCDVEKINWWLTSFHIVQVPSFGANLCWSNPSRDKESTVASKAEYCQHSQVLLRWCPIRWFFFFLSFNLKRVEREKKDKKETSVFDVLFFIIV